MADAKTKKKTETAEPIAFTPEGEPYATTGVADLEPLQTYQAAPMSGAEKAVVTIVAAAATGVVGMLVWAGIKADQKHMEELKVEEEERKRLRLDTEMWFEDKRKEGLVVIETAGGEYMALPAEAYAKSEIRKQDR